MLDKSLSWSSHTVSQSCVANKATRMLNFIKRHLSKCSTATKASAYLLLVRPLMEYACTSACIVWDPYYLLHIQYWRRYREELPDGLYLIIIILVVKAICYTISTGRP